MVNLAGLVLSVAPLALLAVSAVDPEDGSDARSIDWNEPPRKIRKLTPDRYAHMLPLPLDMAKKISDEVEPAKQAGAKALSPPSPPTTSQEATPKAAPAAPTSETTTPTDGSVTQAANKGPVIQIEPYVSKTVAPVTGGGEIGKRVKPPPPPPHTKPGYYQNRTKIYEDMPFQVPKTNRHVKFDDKNQSMPAAPNVKATNASAKDTEVDTKPKVVGATPKTGTKIPEEDLTSPPTKPPRGKYLLKRKVAGESPRVPSIASTKVESSPATGTTAGAADAAGTTPPKSPVDDYPMKDRPLPPIPTLSTATAASNETAATVVATSEAPTTTTTTTTTTTPTTTTTTTPTTPTTTTTTVAPVPSTSESTSESAGGSTGEVTLEDEPTVSPSVSEDRRFGLRGSETSQDAVASEGPDFDDYNGEFRFLGNIYDTVPSESGFLNSNSSTATSPSDASMNGYSVPPSQSRWNTAEPIYDIPRPPTPVTGSIGVAASYKGADPIYENVCRYRRPDGTVGSRPCAARGPAPAAADPGISGLYYLRELDDGDYEPDQSASSGNGPLPYGGHPGFFTHHIGDTMNRVSGGVKDTFKRLTSYATDHARRTKEYIADAGNKVGWFMDDTGQCFKLAIVKARRRVGRALSSLQRRITP